MLAPTVLAHVCCQPRAISAKPVRGTLLASTTGDGSGLGSLEYKLLPSSPRPLNPQHFAPLAAPRAQVWKAPGASVTPVSARTLASTRGTAKFDTGPTKSGLLPSWPLMLLPQHCVGPNKVNAQL